MNIQALSFMTGQAFAVSATSLVGQSLGKKRPDMAQSYSNHTRRLGLIISVDLGDSLLLVWASRS
jgi:Na+-driven multidrug efflux pump